MPEHKALGEIKEYMCVVWPNSTAPAIAWSQITEVIGMQYLAPLYLGARAAPTPVLPLHPERTEQALLGLLCSSSHCTSQCAAVTQLAPDRTQNSLHIPPQDGFKLRVSKVLGDIRTANKGARNKHTQDHTPSNPTNRAHPNSPLLALRSGRILSDQPNFLHFHSTCKEVS